MFWYKSYDLCVEYQSTAGIPVRAAEQIAEM